MTVLESVATCTPLLTRCAFQFVLSSVNAAGILWNAKSRCGLWQVINERWVQSVVTKSLAARATGETYGSEEAMFEQRPFQGSHVMTLAKKHYKNGNVQKMVQLMKQLTLKVVKTCERSPPWRHLTIANMRICGFLGLKVC